MSGRGRVFQSLTGLAAALCSGRALAQGCASCYTTTAAGGQQTIHALRSGILMLFAPPAAIYLILLLIVRHWRSDEGRVAGDVNLMEKAEHR